MNDTEQDNLSPAEIALKFESLGGCGHGCEFGIFQREQGAEPLGLLRWADLSEAFLIQALERRFEGVGEPEFTVVFAPGDAHHGEWWTRDVRYHMAMRTFVKSDEIEHRQMVEKVRRRSKFLRRKLIEDLETGDKIFVFKNMFQNIQADIRLKLFEAIRQYGKGSLLVIQYTDEGHPNATVEVCQPGLMLGYIDHFAFSPKNEFIGSAAGSLLEICKAAISLNG